MFFATWSVKGSPESLPSVFRASPKQMIENPSVFRDSELKVVEKRSVFRAAWAHKFESEAKTVEKTSVFQRPKLKYSRKVVFFSSRRLGMKQ